MKNWTLVIVSIIAILSSCAKKEPPKPVQPTVSEQFNAMFDQFWPTQLVSVPKPEQMELTIEGELNIQRKGYNSPVHSWLWPIVEADNKLEAEGETISLAKEKYAKVKALYDEYKRIGCLDNTHIINVKHKESGLWYPIELTKIDFELLGIKDWEYYKEVKSTPTIKAKIKALEIKVEGSTGYVWVLDGMIEYANKG